MNFIFEQICNLMILYKCFILSWETENTSSYDPQPCTEKLGNEARQITKLLQFLGTKWAPCDKGPSRALTDYKGLSSQTIIYFLPAVFEWSLSADSCFETTSVTATRINLNKTENLQVTVFADVEGPIIIEKRICRYMYQNVFSTKLFCILINIMHGRLVDLLAHVIKSFRSPNNSDATWWFLINVLIYGLNVKGKL